MTENSSEDFHHPLDDLDVDELVEPTTRGDPMAPLFVDGQEPG
jgi:hypothetical protein